MKNAKSNQVYLIIMNMAKLQLFTIKYRILGYKFAPRLLDLELRGLAL